MHTQGTFDVTFGRIDVRAKLPRGDWLWPGKLRTITVLMMIAIGYSRHSPNSKIDNSDGVN